MSSWSSFEKDKAYTDQWRKFLTESDQANLILESGILNENALQRFMNVMKGKIKSISQQMNDPVAKAGKQAEKLQAEIEELQDQIGRAKAQIEAQGVGADPASLRPLEQLVAQLEAKLENKRNPQQGQEQGQEQNTKKDLKTLTKEWKIAVARTYESKSLKSFYQNYGKTLEVLKKIKPQESDFYAENYFYLKNFIEEFQGEDVNDHVPQLGDGRADYGSKLSEIFDLNTRSNAVRAVLYRLLKNSQGQGSEPTRTGGGEPEETDGGEPEEVDGGETEETGNDASKFAVPIYKKHKADAQQQGAPQRSLSSQLQKLFLSRLQELGLDQKKANAIITQILKDVEAQFKANQIQIQEGKEIAQGNVLEPYEIIVKRYAEKKGKVFEKYSDEPIIMLYFGKMLKRKIEGLTAIPRQPNKKPQDISKQKQEVLKQLTQAISIVSRQVKDQLGVGTSGKIKFMNYSFLLNKLSSSNLKKRGFDRQLINLIHSKKSEIVKAIQKSLSDEDGYFVPPLPQTQALLAEDLDRETLSSELTSLGIPEEQVDKLINFIASDALGSHQDYSHITVKGFDKQEEPEEETPEEEPEEETPETEPEEETPETEPEEESSQPSDGGDPILDAIKARVKELDLKSKAGRKAAQENPQAYLGAFMFYKAILKIIKTIDRKPDASTQELLRAGGKELQGNEYGSGSPYSPKRTGPLEEQSISDEDGEKMAIKANKKLKKKLNKIVNKLESFGLTDSKKAIEYSRQARGAKDKDIAAQQGNETPEQALERVKQLVSQGKATKQDLARAQQNVQAGGAETARRTGTAGTINIRQSVSPRLKQGGISLKNQDGSPNPSAAKLQKDLMKVIRRFIRKNLQRVGQEDNIKLIAEDRQFKLLVLSIIKENVKIGITVLSEDQQKQIRKHLLLVENHRRLLSLSGIK